MNVVSKQTFCTILFCFMLKTSMLFAQVVYQPDGLVKKVITGIQIDLASVTVKDNDGKILDVPTTFQMVQSGKYNMETYVDEQDRIKEVVLRAKQNVEQAIITGDKKPSLTVLREELEGIRVKDQALRMLLGCILNTFGGNSDSEGYKYLMLLMTQEDKKNQEDVIKIIDEYGWLGISQVGEIANNALFLVIQHSSVEMQERYFPLLKESAEKGESRLADMALMDDRIRMHRKKKQLYGSQTTSVNGKTYVWPIEDAANVDERRKNVQLLPLADYLKLMGLSYPQDELPSELF